MIKKVGQVGLLLLVKESYLFLKNSLGLVWHPFKTLRHLALEKDRSQQMLILGWPVYVLIMGAGLTYIGRRWLATSMEWGIGARLVFGVGVTGALVMGGYISYWWMRVWQRT